MASTLMRLSDNLVTRVKDRANNATPKRQHVAELDHLVTVGLAVEEGDDTTLAELGLKRVAKKTPTKKA